MRDGMTWLYIVLAVVGLLAPLVLLGFLWVRAIMTAAVGTAYPYGPGGERPDDDMGEMTPELREVFQAWRGTMGPRG